MAQALQLQHAARCTLGCRRCCCLVSCHSIIVGNRNMHTLLTQYPRSASRMLVSYSSCTSHRILEQKGPHLKVTCPCLVQQQLCRSSQSSQAAGACQLPHALLGADGAPHMHNRHALLIQEASMLGSAQCSAARGRQQPGQQQGRTCRASVGPGSQPHPDMRTSITVCCGPCSLRRPPQATPRSQAPQRSTCRTHNRSHRSARQAVRRGQT